MWKSVLFPHHVRCNHYHRVICWRWDLFWGVGGWILGYTWTRKTGSPNWRGTPPKNGWFQSQMSFFVSNPRFLTPQTRLNYFEDPKTSLVYKFIHPSVGGSNRWFLRGSISFCNPQVTPRCPQKCHFHGSNWWLHHQMQGSKFLCFFCVGSVNPLPPEIEQIYIPKMMVFKMYLLSNMAILGYPC